VILGAAVTTGCTSSTVGASAGSGILGAAVTAGCICSTIGNETGGLTDAIVFIKGEITLNDVNKEAIFTAVFAAVLLMTEEASLLAVEAIVGFANETVAFPAIIFVSLPTAMLPLKYEAIVISRNRF